MRKITCLLRIHLSYTVTIAWKSRPASRKLTRRANSNCALARTLDFKGTVRIQEKLTKSRIQQNGSFLELLLLDCWFVLFICMAVSSPCGILTLNNVAVSGKCIQ